MRNKALFILALIWAIAVSGCGGSGKDELQPEATLTPASDSAGADGGPVFRGTSNFPDGDWPQFGAGPAGQRSIDAVIPFAASGIDKVEFQMSEQNADNWINCTPVVGLNSSGDYQVYVVTSDSDNYATGAFDSDLQCYAADTLELLWEFGTEGGNTNKATAAVGRDGTVYFLQHSAGGGLYAINPDNGSLKWKFEDAGVLGGQQVSGPVLWEDNGTDRILLSSEDEFWMLTDQGNGPVVNVNFHTEEHWHFLGSPAVSPAPLHSPLSPSDGHNPIYVLQFFEQTMNPQDGLRLIALDLQKAPFGPADEQESYYPVIDLGNQAMGPILPYEMDYFQESESRWHPQPAIDNYGNVFVSTMLNFYGLTAELDDLPGAWPIEADFNWVGNPAITVQSGQEIIAIQEVSDPLNIVSGIRAFGLNGALIGGSNDFPGLRFPYTAGSPAFDAEGNLVLGFYAGQSTVGGERVGNVRVFKRSGLFWEERLQSTIIPSHENFHVDASPCVAVLPEEGTVAFICCSDGTGDPDSDNDAGQAGGYAHLLKLPLDPWTPEPWTKHTVATNASGNQIAIGYDENLALHVAWVTTPIGSMIQLREAVETSPGSRSFVTHILDSVPATGGSISNISIMIDQGNTGVAYVRQANMDPDPAIERRAAFAYWPSWGIPVVDIDAASENFVPPNCRMTTYNESLNSYWNGSFFLLLSHRGAFNVWNTYNAGSVPFGWTVESLYTHPDTGDTGSFHLKTLNRYDAPFPYQDGIYYGDVNVGTGTTETRVPIEWPTNSVMPRFRESMGMQWFDASSGPLDDSARPIVFYRVFWDDSLDDFGMHCLVGAQMAQADGSFDNHFITLADERIMDFPQNIGTFHTTTTTPNEQAVLCYSMPADIDINGFDGLLRAVYFDYSEGDWKWLGDSDVDDTVPGAMDSMTLNGTLSVAHFSPDNPHLPTTHTIYVSDQPLS